MISDKMQRAFNDQINKELYSAYLYLSMAAYLEDKNFKGMANWMHIQVEEELEHAKSIYKYIIERRGRVALESIQEPPKEFASILDVFESMLAHEVYISSLINKLADYADEDNDRPSASFLRIYIDEQVEEESTAAELVEKVRFANDNTSAMLYLDTVMGGRCCKKISD
ncbi:MAG: ferritin [Candidatus Gastranaerophilales bacterium]|nr:ferritin [Candidatus Gastranaerophilales bacterium]